MKKIGIISELNLNNVNYGNRLQAYALNKYLNTYYKNYETESLIFEGFYDIKKQTAKGINKYLIKAKRIPRKMKGILKNKFNKNKYDFSKRRENCNAFTKKYTKLCSEPLNFEKLENSDYDIFITGSDVVWAQIEGAINRIRFLDFEAKKNFKKIAYAPSFGRDEIPNENVKTIKEILSSFQGISVREKSSITMLKNIGISPVYHVCDPTLLLKKEEWQEIEKKVNIKEKFIFVYLLGKNKQQRKAIQQMAKNLNLKIVSIPHANKVYNIVDKNFGDYQINDCSPEEWIWLIDNAEYVITDSFHGVVFSTIFRKKFIVVKRHYIENINNRMIDYLNTIEEKDKNIDILQNIEISELIWDYDLINMKLNDFIEESKKYLEKNLKI